jgi:hypothetical protein
MKIDSSGEKKREVTLGEKRDLGLKRGLRVRE